MTGKVVMRRTEDYNTDTNEEMKDAVVEAAKNPNVTDALGLKVKPDSVAVEGKRFQGRPLHPLRSL